jgi:hypothetical protein
MRITFEERLLLIVLALTLGAAMLLISAGRGSEEGQVPWKPGSALHLVTRLLNFDYAFPTIRGVAVKRLAAGAGAAAAMFITALAWARRHGPRPAVLPEPAEPVADRPEPREPKRWKATLSAVDAAQLALLALVAWSFISAIWSPWSEVALGESALLAVGVVWAVCLGRGLSRRAATAGAGILIAALTVTAVIGLWYFYERNPYQRLKFPVGNPLFLGACLVPGALLAAHMAIGSLWTVISERRYRRLLWVPLAAAALVPLLWALRFTQARGALVGLGVGLWVGLFMVLGGRLAWPLLATGFGGILAFWEFGTGGGHDHGYLRTVFGHLWVFTYSHRWILCAAVVLAGVCVAVLAIRSMAWRRRAVLAALIALYAMPGVGLYAGTRYFQTKINDLEGGRGATLRLRLYGSKYAWGQFLGRPALGLGQGGYSLVVDALSRADAENDPAAFVGERMVHAHNEWLETLADLGAVGIALVAVGYGVTFWACRQVIGRQGLSLQGWCAIGLVASVAAVMLEEATDVGLRMPGLPVVWYTVLGLAWAMMRSDEAPAGRAVPFARPVLWLGTGAAFAAAIVILVWTTQDWQGALAEGRVRPAMNEKRWADATAEAEAGAQHRLASDEITTSLGQKILCFCDIGAYHLTTLRASAQGRPLSETQGTPLGEVQRQDVAAARSYIVAAHNETGRLLTHVPSYPYVAGELGRLLLYWVQVAGEVGSMLTRTEAQEIQNEGRGLILAEYNRNPLNVEAALRCVAAWPDRPIDDRIEWLCTALRGCWVPTGPPEYRAIVAAIMNEEGFGAALERRVQAAQASAAATRWTDWQDRFAPETCRLWAMVLSFQGDWAQAAQAEEYAIRMYRLIRIPQPAMLPIAIAEKAWYVFESAPDHPEGARRLSALALSEIPPIGSREQLAEPIRRSLILYCLADGAESEAAPIVAELIADDDPEVVMHQMGLAYVELAAGFARVDARNRPDGFSLWVDRAMQLAPDSATLQLVLAQVAFENERDSDVVEAFKRAESLGIEPERIDEMLDRAVSRRPESKPLADYKRERQKARPTTATATTTTTATAPAPDDAGEPGERVEPGASGAPGASGGPLAPRPE